MLVRSTFSNAQRITSSAIMPALIALTATAVAACSSESPDVPAGFERDPLTIVRVLTDALNEQQFDGALAFFADDVAFTGEAGETSTGKSSVLTWMQTRAQQRSDLCDVWLAGDTVTWTVRTSDHGTMKSQAVLQDGKIKSFRWISSDRED